MKYPKIYILCTYYANTIYKPIYTYVLGHIPDYIVSIHHTPATMTTTGTHDAMKYNGIAVLVLMDGTKRQTHTH